MAMPPPESLRSRRQSAAGELAVAAPVRLPFRHALGVRGPEGVQRDGADGPDAAGLDDLLGELHHRGVLVVVRREHHPAMRARGVDQRARLGHAGGERLLAEHVDAALQRGKRDLRVRVWRRGDVDEVELRLAREQVAKARVQPRFRNGRPSRFQPRRGDVRDGDDLDVLALQVRRVVPLPGDETEADDRSLQHPLSSEFGRACTRQRSCGKAPRPPL